METSTYIFYIIIMVSSYVSIKFSQRLFLRLKIQDDIVERSSHSVIATRSGGIAIFSIILITSVYNYLKGIEIFDFSLIIPLSLLVFVGIYDDVYKLDFKLKFIFQIIAAKIIIDNGFIIDNLHGVFGIYETGRVFAQVLTIFIIVAIINSINFIDGIDGLAISIVLLFLFFFEFFAKSQTILFNLTVIIMCSIMPLFLFNFRKEQKVFLGDSGSLFLGGVTSIYIIHILTNSYIIKETYDIHKILFVLSIFIYPVVDIIRIFFLRIYRGKSPFDADKNHIHHLLLKETNSHFITTFIIVLTSLLFLLLIQIMF